MLEAGVVDEEPPPNKFEPPVAPPPKIGFAPGVLEPEFVVLLVAPNRLGVDPPEVLPAPNRGCCLGVLLPPKLNPDILSVCVGVYVVTCVVMVEEVEVRTRRRLRAWGGSCNK